MSSELQQLGTVPFPVLRGWAYRAGIARKLHKATYKEANVRLRNWLEKLLIAAATIMEHSNATTLVLFDIYAALQVTEYFKLVSTQSLQVRQVLADTTNFYPLFGRRYTARELFDLSNNGRLDFSRDLADKDEVNEYVEALFCEEREEDDSSDSDVEDDNIDTENRSESANSDPPQTSEATNAKQPSIVEESHVLQESIVNEYQEARQALMDYKEVVENAVKHETEVESNLPQNDTSLNSRSNSGQVVQIGEATNNESDREDDDEDDQIALLETELRMREYTKETESDDDLTLIKELFSGIVGDEGYAEADHLDRMMNLQSTDGLLLPIAIFKKILASVCSTLQVPCTLTRDAMSFVHFCLEQYAEECVFDQISPQFPSVLYYDLEHTNTELVNRAEKLSKQLNEAKELNQAKDERIAQLEAQLAVQSASQSVPVRSLIVENSPRETTTRNEVSQRTPMSAVNPAASTPYTAASSSSEWTQATVSTPMPTDPTSVLGKRSRDCPGTLEPQDDDSCDPRARRDDAAWKKLRFEDSQTNSM